MFVDERGLSLRYIAVKENFDRLPRKASVRPRTARRPRLHDLRHTFAVRALQGSPAGRSQCGALATYMGHVNIYATYLYREATADLMRDVAAASEGSCPRGGDHDTRCSPLETFLRETPAQQQGVSRHTSDPCPTPICRGLQDDPIAVREVIERLQAVYAIEAENRGSNAEQRLAARRTRTAPLMAALKTQLTATVGQLFSQSKLTESINYALNHWDGLSLFLRNGRVEVDSKAIERSMRPIAMGRRNSLFSGSEGGAESWAILSSIVNTAKLHELDPQLYLADVLERIVSERTKSHQLHELLAWNWKAARHRRPRHEPRVIIKQRRRVGSRDAAYRARAVAAEPRWPTPYRHQSPYARRLRRRDRGRTGIDEPARLDLAAASPSMPMLSTTATLRSSRRSLPSHCATTRPVRRSRQRLASSRRCAGVKPMAISMRVPGAKVSPPRCRRGCRCWMPTTLITACCCRSCCTVATIRAARCSERQSRPCANIDAGPLRTCALITAVTQPTPAPTGDRPD